jgi:hypothetical protein
MDISKFKPLFLTFCALFLLGLLALIIVRTTNETATADSDVLYGGQLEAGFPYAGYLLGFTDNNKLNVCGSVFLTKSKLVTAAHCVDKEVRQNVVGSGQLEISTAGKNNRVDGVAIKPGWDGKTSNNDLAVVTLEQPVQMTKFAEIGSPELGCNYTVVAYGRTENSDEDSLRLRKSAKLCISRIERDLIFLQGSDSGICFGDSGSPVFLTGSNKLIGVISAIVATSSDDSPCHIANQAVAVRVDVNQSFIQSASGISEQTASKAICGADCTIQTCGIGLVCGSNNLCQLPSGNTCFARLDGYCDSQVNIFCQNGSQCLGNKCVIVSQAGGQVTNGNLVVGGTQLNVNTLIVGLFVFVDILVVLSLIHSLRSRRKSVVPPQTNIPPINTTRLTV